jgi:phosphoglycerol transferase MdoB-like AlkP superfamily enzyme
MWQGLASMWRLAQIGHSRSSVINPLQWTLVIILIGLLVSIGEKAASWLLVFFAALLAATLLLLIVAYVYFMFRNPADLRSEKYSLAKTAMEKRLVGDSLSGLREVMDAFDGQDSKLLSNPENKDIEHSNG